MTQKAAALALLMVFAGCSGTQERWQKSGASAAEYSQTAFRCNQRAQSLTRDFGHSISPGYFVYQNFYHSCMMDNGWVMGGKITE
ncbi:MAG: hypothetical protein ORO03_05625 [Alphaproteobacteria bacterium]|nr:hypothetical protein [Alphaproteobacteria bacterium]